jgi:hypothetical protein
MMICIGTRVTLGITIYEALSWLVIYQLVSRDGVRPIVGKNDPKQPAEAQMNTTNTVEWRREKR